jgi:hypothetical protein
MNEHAETKLKTFAAFFGPAARQQHVPATQYTNIHWHCDNCTACVDGTMSWVVGDSLLTLCGQCYNALRSLRQPIDAEKCKKFFSTPAFAAGKRPRVAAMCSYFEWRAVTESQ